MTSREHGKTVWATCLLLFGSPALAAFEEKELPRREQNEAVEEWGDDDGETRYTPEWESRDWDRYDYDYDAYQDPYGTEDSRRGPRAYDTYGYDFRDPDVYGADSFGSLGREYDQEEIRRPGARDRYSGFRDQDRSTRTPPEGPAFNPEEDDYFSAREAARTDTALGGYYTEEDEVITPPGGLPYGGYGGYFYDGGRSYPPRYFADDWWR